MSLNVRTVGEHVDSEGISLATSHFQVIFSIQNFDRLEEQGATLTSPIFLDPNGGDQWRIQFAHHTPQLAKVTLQLVTSEPAHEIKTSFQICILDQEKKIEWAGRSQQETFFPKRDGVFAEKFSISGLSDPTNGWLVEGSLWFYVQVLTSRPRSLICDLTTSQPAEQHQNELSGFFEQFKSFLVNANFADVILTSESGRFPASKILLAAQSPVFFAMFNSEMEESKSNAVVKIEEFSDEIIHGFLEFIYTGKTLCLEENAAELLKISDKYQTLSLKGKCERILLTNLNVENALDILVLAHLHSPTELKPKVIPFINKNFKDLKNTESYGRMKKEYPQIVFDLYEAMHP